METRGQLASIESAIRIKVTSLRVVLGHPSRRGTMPAREGSVKDAARARTRLENDAEREVQRAAGADERTGQLEIGTRVDEEPGVFLPEAETTELVETPADDALILLRQLVGGMWELCCGHVSALTTGYPSSLLAERKAWLRRRCALLPGGR